ncbi:MAG: bifunctional (p)ppGpp synthetase/guanosine-3',5'-bis(diphosphate) 3'-pyrophosphohydrolase [Bacteroidetes bacterium]|nr:bifunctional (p)ppGpp synthetase/guanosine-3',5'-bis(diphosphate) 3'-pyrophosphohydrolase [Bacteroidota bacterium]
MSDANQPILKADTSEDPIVLDPEGEKKEILKRYKALLKACKPNVDKSERKLIRKAFDLSLEAHKDMRRKSGEPYIFHPIAVAMIVAEEIGLGELSIVCALLHDVVEDTQYTLEDIERLFNKKVAGIVDGLTKISGVFDHTSSLQAENFRKMLLTLSDDVRVILIKIADRLHNMRTLGSMPKDKQLKIASETAYLYAPLAHRMGLYSIKNELDDLALKYTEPEVFKTIALKLQQSKKEREKFIQEFTKPIREELDKEGFKYDIKGRPKSINSIWTKMKKQEVSFEEVYDLFAIRIIVDTPYEREKADCWKVYSVVTDYFTPNPDRLRDWISTPKVNGYESLHTTVMSKEGKWVEVQIRTKRMDEIAEKGYAAHWKYKESSQESAIDEWISRIRDLLDNSESNALDFIDDFKLNLFADEIFVFTPSGEIKTLPVGSTALDFAFEIHSDIGTKCIGAKINHRLVSISHQLKSGDQVEVLTSAKQFPKDDWLGYVVTAKAKSKIKTALKEEKRKLAEMGKDIFERKMKSLKMNNKPYNVNELLLFYKVSNLTDFYHRIGLEAIDLKNLRDFFEHKEQGTLKLPEKSDKQTFDDLVKTIRGKSDMLVIGEGIDKIDYKLSPCCNPIPGDEVFGFITINEGIKIHRTNCPNAIQLMSNYAYRIVKARWFGQQQIAFLVGIKINGMDDVGVVSNITKIISSELKVNIRSLNIESTDGLFEGTIMLFVHDTEHLKVLMKKLVKLPGILSVTRIDSKA